MSSVPRKRKRISNDKRKPNNGKLPKGMKNMKRKSFRRQNSDDSKSPQQHHRPPFEDEEITSEEDNPVEEDVEILQNFNGPSDDSTQETVESVMQNLDELRIKQAKELLNQLGVSISGGETSDDAIPMKYSSAFKKSKEDPCQVIIDRVNIR